MKTDPFLFFILRIVMGNLITRVIGKLGTFICKMFSKRVENETWNMGLERNIKQLLIVRALQTRGKRDKNRTVRVRKKKKKQ